MSLNIFTRDASTYNFRLPDMKLMASRDPAIVNTVSNENATEEFSFPLASFMRDIQGYLETEKGIYAPFVYYTITDSNGVRVNMYIITDDSKIKMAHDVVYKVFPFNIGNIETIVVSYTPTPIRIRTTKSNLFDFQLYVPDQYEQFGNIECDDKKYAWLLLVIVLGLLYVTTYS
jgi:hypothetical protein